MQPQRVRHGDPHILCEQRDVASRGAATRETHPPQVEAPSLDQGRTAGLVAHAQRPEVRVAQAHRACFLPPNMHLVGRIDGDVSAPGTCAGTCSCTAWEREREREKERETRKRHKDKPMEKCPSVVTDAEPTSTERTEPAARPFVPKKTAVREDDGREKKARAHQC